MMTSRLLVAAVAALGFSLVACASESVPEQRDGTVHLVKRVTREEAAAIQKQHDEAPLMCLRYPYLCTVTDDGNGMAIVEQDCQQGVGCCY